MHEQGSFQMQILTGAAIAEIFEPDDRTIEPKTLEG